MNNRTLVVSVKQTCYICPSLWVGQTDTGGEVSVRFRWGHLRVRVNDKTVFTFETGDGLDGIAEPRFSIAKARYTKEVL